MKILISTILFLILLFLVDAHATGKTQIKALHYTIHAELFPSKNRLVAETEMLIKNAGDSRAEEIYFNLSFDVLHWVRDQSGNNISYVRSENGIRLRLPLSPSESTRIRLKHEGTFFGLVSGRIEEDNSWLLGESLWFPQLGSWIEGPSWFTCDLFVTVPREQTAVSHGKLVSTTETNDKRVFHWSMTNPTWAISLVSAKYVEMKDTSYKVPVTAFLFSQPTEKIDSLKNLVRSILDFYSREFGEYQFGELRVVETNRRGGYGPPGMILLNSNFLELPDDTSQLISTSLLIAHELAHQWWGSSIVSLPWFLNESLAQYSAYQYAEQQGFTRSTLSATSFRSTLVGIDLRVKLGFKEAVYYWNQRPTEFRSISELSPGDRDYVWASYYKGTCFLQALSSRIGEDTMQKALRVYADRFKLQTASLQDFRTTVEEVSMRNLGEFFHDWVFTTKKLDYALVDLREESTPEGKLKTTAIVENCGDISMPVRLKLTTINGQDHSLIVDEFNGKHATVELETTEPVISAIIDPGWHLLDVNRTNNIWPRKHRISFLIANPSVDVIEYYYGPSLTYGLTDGIRIGAWLTNNPPLPVRKQIIHPFEWRMSGYYGIKSRKPGYSLLLDSWYGMPSNRWKYGALLENVRGTETYELNGGYSWTPDDATRLSFSYTRLYDVSYYDPQDFEEGRMTLLSASHAAKIYGMQTTAKLDVGIPALGSKYDFQKGSLTITGWYPFLPRTSFRLFAGMIRGDFPSQQAFFLSGAVTPTGAAFWFLDPDRKISTQRGLHMTGDANLRGYIGNHRRGKSAVALNSDFVAPMLSFLRAFVDVGSVWNSARPDFLWNAGIGLDFQFLRFDFPFFLSDPPHGKKPFDFRWLVEIKI